MYIINIKGNYSCHGLKKGQMELVSGLQWEQGEGRERGMERDRKGGREGGREEEGESPYSFTGLTSQSICTIVVTHDY